MFFRKVANPCCLLIAEGVGNWAEIVQGPHNRMRLNVHPMWKVDCEQFDGGIAQRICITTLALVLYSMPKGSGPYVLERYEDSGTDRPQGSAQRRCLEHWASYV